MTRHGRDGGQAAALAPQSPDLRQAPRTTGKPSASEPGNLRSASREIRTPGDSIDSAIRMVLPGTTVALRDDRWSQPVVRDPACCSAMGSAMSLLVPRPKGRPVPAAERAGPGGPSGLQLVDADEVEIAERGP